MYGDPSRVSAGSLDGYIEGLNIPGTVDHVLEIVRRWSLDMSALHEELTRIAAKPTLLIWGDRDRTVGLTSGCELQRTLTQSRLMVLPGVGHIPFEEMPDVCNQAMRDWLLSPLPATRSLYNEALSFIGQPVDHSSAA